jgi:large subunit ribosomal protein L18
MATGPRYAVRFRRRREGKTNYRKRALLLKSGKPRLVVRCSNNYIRLQIIEYDIKGDKTKITVDSSILKKKYGWKYSCKNIPAAYLTGLLAGKLALKSGFSEAVSDIGLKTKTKGAKVFAAIKGAADAGLKVNINPEILPAEARISGQHIATYLKNNIVADFEALKTKLEKEK